MMVAVHRETRQGYALVVARKGFTLQILRYVSPCARKNMPLAEFATGMKGYCWAAAVEASTNSIDIQRRRMPTIIAA